MNAGKGHEKGHGLTHTETTLDAGGGISLTSGRDTTLKGAQVSGEKITADVGRDLTLHSNFDSVNEQTGLFAGDGGYEITVGGHTQLNCGKPDIME